MGKRTSYEPGIFCWVELSTTDPDAAKEFYGALLGWDAEDLELPDGGVYSMMRIGDETAAAIQRQPEAQAGLPPFWFNYITVASADETAEAAKAAGANVHVDPFDVLGAGRMAVIMDPTGAAFGIWEARDQIGATIVNDTGALTWNELSTGDPAAAEAFYEQVFGWKIEPVDAAGGPPYWVISHEGGADGQNGGMRELAPEQADAGVAPHWLPYFNVESTDDAVAEAGEMGGRTMFGPIDLPAGRIAVMTDPQGAAFAVFEGHVDD